MTANEARAAYLSLPADQRRFVVALLGHNLTIDARAAGAESGQIPDQLVIKRLLGLNELQHTVTAKLMNMASGTSQSFPDEAFLDVLFETAELRKCEGALVQAFQWSLQPSYGGVVTPSKLDD
jgi:hypothetical protein